jgi:hypothetical protein
MIENVYQQGDDALANMAELQFPIFNLFGLADPLKFRTTAISIPEFAILTYDVHWKTQKFEKPGGKDETAKTMNFTFRIDKYYTVYKGLMAWWQFICNSDTGAMAEDVGAITKTSNIRCDFQVRVVDSNNVTTTEGWKFFGAWIKSMASVEFSQDSGEPLTCAVTMSYVKAVPQF